MTERVLLQLKRRGREFSLLTACTTLATNVILSCCFKQMNILGQVEGESQGSPFIGESKESLPQIWELLTTIGSQIDVSEGSQRFLNFGINQPKFTVQFGLQKALNTPNDQLKIVQIRNKSVCLTMHLAQAFKAFLGPTIMGRVRFACLRECLPGLAAPSILDPYQLSRASQVLPCNASCPVKGY